MSRAYERAVELRKESDSLPYGATKVALLQEAVELADAIGSLKLAYELRSALVKAATFSGRPDAMLVAFAWNLAQFDRDPSAFDRQTLLWQYKWIAVSARSFPEIERARLEAALDDLERRHREAGSTLRAVALVRRKYQTHRDDLEAAEAAHRLYRERPRDDLCDSAGCEMSSDVFYLTRRCEWARAAELARRALDAGIFCDGRPQGLLGTSLLPLFLLGDLEQADHLQRRGYRLIESHAHALGIHADHLEYLALRGDLAGAKRVVERHWVAGTTAVNLLDRYYFLDAALLWAERLLNLGTTRIKLRLAAEASGNGADGAADVETLRAWLQERVLDIGGRFDARNGTDGFRKREDRRGELLELAREPWGRIGRGDG